jgi:hypothetical protein
MAYTKFMRPLVTALRDPTIIKNQLQLAADIAKLHPDTKPFVTVFLDDILALLNTYNAAVQYAAAVM